MAAINYQEEAPAQPEQMVAAKGTAFDEVQPKDCKAVNMDAAFNSNVSDIFKNKYVSPRSPYTTLCVPTQGIGDWCSTKRTANIDDTKLRSMVKNGVLTLDLRQENGVANEHGDSKLISFRSPAEGKNIAYTSLWDNYPDSISIPLKGKASHAYLMMAGSTNPMQFDMANGVIIVEYVDGTTDELELHSPSNWCPIEQDFLENAKAFPIPSPRPYRVGLSTGVVSRHLFRELNGSKENKSFADMPEFKKAISEIDGGAAILLDMPLNPKKKLRNLKLKVLSNEVVIGLMGITLQK